MDDRGRDIIDKLNAAGRKVMRFIYLAEMLDNIRALYKNIEKMIRKVMTFLEEKNPEEMKWVSTHERQSFKDGMVSISTTVQEIDQLHDDLNQLEEYTYTIDHF